MNVLIVYCHPEPKSFNHAMFSVAEESLKKAGHSVKTSDIYGMGFDPLSSRKNYTTVANPDYLKTSAEDTYAFENDGFEPLLEGEIQKMEWCDLMIWQFPLWWYGLPAGLKGWVDKVFAYDRVYGFGHMFDKGKMAGKHVLLSVSTGVPAAGYKPGAVAGDINLILKPIHYGILQFVGFKALKPHVVHAPAHMSDEQRQSEFERYADRLTTVFEESPIPTEGF